MKPAQLPHPPFWYAVPVPEGAAWPAQNKHQHRLRRAAAARARDHRPLSRRMGGGGKFAGRYSAARHQPLRGRGRYRPRSDGARPPRLADVLCELHEALEEARHPAALCEDSGGFRHHGQQWRRARGLARHDPRSGEQHGRARPARATSSRNSPSATSRRRRCCIPPASSPARCLPKRGNALSARSEGWRGDTRRFLSHRRKNSMRVL